MSNRSPLHITAHEYQEMTSNERQLEAFIHEFFCVSPEDTQYAAIEELLTNLFEFARVHLTSIDAACALVTLLVDLHELNISKTTISHADLRVFAKKRLITYSLECPPFYTSFLEADVIKATAKFVDYTYINNYKLWRYLFCPVPVLEIKAKKALDLIEVQSLLQLGYSEEVADAASATPASGAAKSGAVSSDLKPRSSLGERPAGAKKGQSVAEAVPEPVQPQRILLPFNSVPLSLSEATLYQPPAPKTEEELVAEEIREQIEQAYVKDKAEEEAEQKEEVDVERLARVIETATNAEFTKLRERMLAELDGSTAAAPGKKDAKK